MYMSLGIGIIISVFLLAITISFGIIDIVRYSSAYIKRKNKDRRLEFNSILNEIPFFLSIDDGCDLFAGYLLIPVSIIANVFLWPIIMPIILWRIILEIIWVIKQKKEEKEKK